MERSSFSFKLNYYEAFKNLPDDLRLKCYDLIAEYGLFMNAPETDDPIVNMVFQLLKPDIDANYQRYLNGCKGGRPRKNPKPNITTSIPADDNAVMVNYGSKKAKTSKFKSLLSLDASKEEAKEEPEEVPVPEKEPAETEPEEIKPAAASDPELLNLGKNKNVFISKNDYNELVEEYGMRETEDAIQILDGYIESLEPAMKEKYRKRNHKACLINWAFQRVEEKKAHKEYQERQLKEPRRKVNNFVNFPQNTYNFKELEKQLLEN